MRILKSRRAISGAVTALILVIVSVALALAVAVFAFGLFGSFGNSGQLQITSTPLVNVVSSNTGYTVSVIFNVKNGGATPASLQSIQVAGYLSSTPSVYVVGSNQATGSNQPTNVIPAGYAGEVTVTFSATALPSSLTSPNNVGGSVQINMVFTQGSLSPTFTLQGILNSTK